MFWDVFYVGIMSFEAPGDSGRQGHGSPQELLLESVAPSGGAGRNPAPNILTDDLV